MSRHRCTKELYKAFLQASSMRYSGLALSEVSPIPLSHDSISRWLADKHFRPREIWSIASHYIPPSEPCLLIADDTVLSKTRSQKIELVNYQYSGNAHDVIAGIGLINMLLHRIVNRNVRLETLELPEEGLSVHLRGFGWVFVFKFVAKNGRIDYVTTNMENPTREQVKHIMDARWSVEVYHREIKQTCGIERCQARTGRAQRNHIFLAIAAWFEQHKIRITQKIILYQQNWSVIKNAIQEQIKILMLQAA